MATFTRLQLRTYQTDSADFSGARNFSLENNLNTTAYFVIEGVNSKDIFNSASITSLVNCSMVTESTHAGFIIDSGSTATFTFTPSSTIAKEDVYLVAPNPLVYSPEDITSSGSVSGVNLDTNA